MSELTEGLKRAIRFRIGQMVSRIILTAIDDTGLDVKGSVSHQRVDGDTFASGGTNRNATRFQDYGVTSVPLVGAEGLALQVGGSPSRLAIVNVDDPRHRPINLEPGEVQIYTDEGLVLHAKRGRIVTIRGDEIDASIAGEVAIAGETLDLDATNGAADLNASGAVNIGGMTVVITGTTTIEGTAWAGHTHSVGTISAPGGGSYPGAACLGNTGGVV